MNVAKALRFAPTLSVAAAMAYAAYSIESPVQVNMHAPTPKAVPSDRGNDLASTNASAEPSGLRRGDSAHRRRNPFLVTKPKQIGKASGGNDGYFDPNIAFVKSLTLNGTFIQGTIQYASINGRLYRQGQHIGDADNKLSSLVIAHVGPMDVTLADNGRNYTLAYPEEFRASTRPGKAKTEPAGGIAKRGGYSRGPALPAAP